VGSSLIQKGNKEIVSVKVRTWSWNRCCEWLVVARGKTYCTRYGYRCICRL